MQECTCKGEKKRSVMGDTDEYIILSQFKVILGGKKQIRSSINVFTYSYQTVFTQFPYLTYIIPLKVHYCSAVFAHLLLQQSNEGPFPWFFSVHHFDFSHKGHASLHQLEKKGSSPDSHIIL